MMHTAAGERPHAKVALYFSVLIISPACCEVIGCEVIALDGLRIVCGEARDADA